MQAFFRCLNIGEKLKVFGVKIRVFHSISKPIKLTEQNRNIKL